MTSEREYEEHVVNWLRACQARGALWFAPQCIRVRSETGRQVLAESPWLGPNRFDASFEVWAPGGEAPRFAWIWEVYALRGPVGVHHVQRVETAMSKVEVLATRCSIVSESGFTTQAILVAKDLGICLMRIPRSIRWPDAEQDWTALWLLAEKIVFPRSEIEYLDQVLDVDLLCLPRSPKVIRLDYRAIDAPDGRSALEITVVLDEDTPDEVRDWDHLGPAEERIRELLDALGESRVVVVKFRTPAELKRGG